MHDKTLALHTGTTESSCTIGDSHAHGLPEKCRSIPVSSPCMPASWLVLVATPVAVRPHIIAVNNNFVEQQPFRMNNADSARMEMLVAYNIQSRKGN